MTPLSTGEVARILSSKLGEQVTERQLQGILTSNPHLSPGMVSNRRVWSKVQVARLTEYMQTARAEQKAKKDARAKAKAKGGWRKMVVGQAHYSRLLSAACEAREVLLHVLEEAGEGLEHNLHLDSDQVDSLRDLLELLEGVCMEDKETR
jgi:hypothetical protein